MLLKADADNEIRLGVKDGGANDIRSRYEAATTVEVNVHTVSTTAWFSLAMSWSAADDKVRYYLNGAPDGAAGTGLGVWAGNIGSALIGASTTGPLAPWNGYIAHMVVWDRALTPAEVLSLGVL